MLALHAAALALLGAHSADAATPKQRQPGWKTTPYVVPVAGASAFSNGRTSTTAVWVGGQAGLRYRQVRKPFPRLRGEARLLGTYVLSTGNTRGYEVRLGNFLGPQWKHVGIRTGPDLFVNQYQYGTTTLPQTAGLAWPAILTGRVEALHAYAGFEPAWYLGDQRLGVDWSETDAVGVGDEFSWLAGASIGTRKLRLGLDWRRRTTSYGTDNQWGVNVSFNAFPGGRW